MRNSVIKSYDSTVSSSHFNSTIEVPDKSKHSTKTSVALTFLKELRFIPGFRQFPGLKICLIISLLHKLHLYSTFLFIDNLQDVRNVSSFNLHNDSIPSIPINQTPCEGVNPEEPHFAIENTKVVASVFMAFVYLLAPVPGFLADRYFSRHRTVLTCLLLCMIGSLIQSVFHTYYEQLRMGHGELSDYIYYIIHFGSIVLLVCGSTGVVALLVPLGVDQMEGASEQTIKSYFNWHYWAGNMGGLLAPGGYFIYKSTESGRYLLLFGSYIATLSMAIAVVIFIISLFCNILQKHKPVGSPISKIASVVRSATRGYREEKEEYDRKSLLDYAVGDKKGRQSFEVVDDVKTFFRMTAVFGFMIWYFGTYNLLTTVFPQQGQALTCSKNSFFAGCFIVLADGLAVSIAIPIMEFVRKKYYTIRITKILYKFLIGVLLSLAALYFAWLTDMIRYYTGFLECTAGGKELPMSGMFLINAILLPQIILIGVSEAFSMVSAIEFVYAQAPHDMKGFLFGLMNFFTGLGFYNPTILYTILWGITCDPIRNVSCQFCMVYESSCFLNYQTPSFMYFLLFAVITTLYAPIMYLVAEGTCIELAYILM